MTKHHNLFWVTLTMKLQPLVELSLILILASYAKGEGWIVHVNKTINAKLGDNVTIPCTFTYPKKNHTKEPELHWKLRRKSNNNTYDKQNNSIYLYHPNETHVEEKYRGRTKLIGNSSNGNCSLKIFNITDNEPNIYLRILTYDNYSFVKTPVSIYVSGATPVPTTPAIFTETTPQPPSGPMYAAIFVSAAAALIIIFVIGFFLFRHKREQSLTREDSGYYANFSRASSNQATRKELCKKQDNKELPDLKTFDDPVYINMEAPAGQMDQSVDHTDNIYANMDYHK
ncbi:uncharacterized protein LOC122987090 isoform X1 [Thunnus albacares]|uniref:uncharacterized protein LOC122987090 isoform X1 n=1 Tax=Thunnus albacares TaxID=8236 RepID=UPI001CF69E1A|nr:uncharacterized protein LOC122987090 isoform X1 [Thunnus albacares]